MNRPARTLILAFFLFLLHDNHPAEGAQGKRRNSPPSPAPQLEVYPSIELTTNHRESKNVPPDTSLLEPSDESNSTSQTQDETQQRPKKLSATGLSTLQPRNLEYEAVPREQRELIAERLKWVERLLLETGKAYDYRLMTVSQLRKIFEQSTQTSPTQDRGPRPDRTTEVPLPPQAL